MWHWIPVSGCHDKEAVPNIAAGFIKKKKKKVEDEPIFPQTKGACVLLFNRPPTLGSSLADAFFFLPGFVLFWQPIVC